MNIIQDKRESPHVIYSGPRIPLPASGKGKRERESSPRELYQLFYIKINPAQFPRWEERLNLQVEFKKFSAICKQLGPSYPPPPYLIFFSKRQCNFFNILYKKEKNDYIQRTFVQQKIKDYAILYTLENNGLYSSAD